MQHDALSHETPVALTADCAPPYKNAAATAEGVVNEGASTGHKMGAGNAGLIHVGEGNLDGIDRVTLQMEKTCASSVLSTILDRDIMASSRERNTR